MALKTAANSFTLFVFLTFLLLVQDSLSLMTRKMMQKKYQTKSCDTNVCTIHPDQNLQLNITTQCNKVDLSA